MAFLQPPKLQGQSGAASNSSGLDQSRATSFGGVWSEVGVWNKSLPAWLMSLILHATLLVLFGLAMRQVPRGVVGEPDRTTGIALVKIDDGEEQYVLESDQESESDAPSPDLASQALSDVLPSQEALAVDLTGVLPTAPDGALDVASAGTRELGESIRGGKAAAAGSGGTTTSVFGIEGTGTRFVYVFDRSGSMDGFGGAPLKAAKSELLSSLKDLARVNQFQIIFYNERPRVFNPTGGPPKLVWGDDAGKQLATQFVTGISATGGTRHMEALRLALGMRPDVVFFLTDADEPQMTQNELRRVRRLNYGSAIHAIEFGYGPKRSEFGFLKQLAQQNQGKHVYVDVAKLRSRQKRKQNAER